MSAVLVSRRRQRCPTKGKKLSGGSDLVEFADRLNTSQAVAVYSVQRLALLADRASAVHGGAGVALTLRCARPTANEATMCKRDVLYAPRESRTSAIVLIGGPGVLPFAGPSFQASLSLCPSLSLSLTISLYFSWRAFTTPETAVTKPERSLRRHSSPQPGRF